jgi:hypothetical protein
MIQVAQQRVNGGAGMAARAWETLAESVMTQYAAVKDSTWHEVDEKHSVR